MNDPRKLNEIQVSNQIESFIEILYTKYLFSITLEIMADTRCQLPTQKFFLDKNLLEEKVKHISKEIFTI